MYLPVSTVNQTIHLSSKTGDQAVCPGQYKVYFCKSEAESLTWNVSPKHFTETFHTSDNLLRSVRGMDGYLVATLLCNTSGHMASQFVVPYNDSWNGNVISCSNGNINTTRTLLYSTAGS